MLIIIIKANEIFQNYVLLNIILKSGVMDNNWCWNLIIPGIVLVSWHKNADLHRETFFKKVKVFN